MFTRPKFLARAAAMACAALAAMAPSAQAHVIIDSPNGGQVYVPGEVVTVTWHIAIAHNLLNWDLWYSTTGPNGPWIPIATDYMAGSPLVGVPHTFDWTVPDTPSTQVRLRARMDNSTADYYDVSDGDMTILPACPAPVVYCSSFPNSNGPGASIGHSGSTSLAANDFVLVGQGAAANVFGLFFYGAAQTQVPFGDGLRCVDPGGIGLFRLGPPLTTSPTGDASRSLDYNSPPLNAGPGEILAGSVWNFQLWFRDGAAGASGFNLSDAISVTFCM